MQDIDVERDMSSRLHGIRMKRNPPRTDARADLRDRLYGTDLVVRRHDTDECRVCTQCRLHGAGLDASIPINGNLSYREAPMLQRTARLAHSCVLHRGDHNVCAAARRPAFLRNPAQRPIVALCTSARKVNLFRQRPNQCCCLFPRACNRMACRLSERVQARRIAVDLRQIRLHCL